MIVLTLLVGNQNYNGTGVNIIAQCIDGTVRPEAFLLKMIFTAATLGAGYKGGEIVPSFFTGAAFGCLFGNLLGFSPALCTAVGMAAVFCGVTNCPITSLLISFELFGYDGMPYFYWQLLSATCFPVISDSTTARRSFTQSIRRIILTRKRNKILISLVRHIFHTVYPEKNPVKQKTSAYLC